VYAVRFFFVSPKSATASSVTPRRRSDGEITRRKVLDAAVVCILENGYYKTSSNQIARVAGVTWGTLQHQFGTREGLMLELLNDEWVRMQGEIADATVDGETLEERLESTMTILAGHYGSSRFLAFLEVLLDLTQDPATSDETKKGALAHGRRLSRAWQPLFAQALGDAAEDKELVGHAFKVLRGYLIGESIATRFAKSRNDKGERQFVIEGVAASVRARAAAQGTTIR
jgi:AcrR family transcriptional regulator